MSKTFVAIRPGFQQAAIAAFGADMEIVIDDTLTQDYEFRQRELGLADLLEAELEGEESQAAKKADPKNAHTFVVPLLGPDDDLDEEYRHCTYLAVRVDRKDDMYEAVNRIVDTSPILHDDDRINVKATVTMLHNHLKNEGFKVHSISVVNGLTVMGS